MALGTYRIGALLSHPGQFGVYYRNGNIHRPVAVQVERTCGENASTCMQVTRQPLVRTRTSYTSDTYESTHLLGAGSTRCSGSADSARGLASHNQDKSASHRPRS